MKKLINYAIKNNIVIQVKMNGVKLQWIYFQTVSTDILEIVHH